MSGGKRFQSGVGKGAVAEPADDLDEQLSRSLLAAGVARDAVEHFYRADVLLTHSESSLVVDERLALPERLPQEPPKARQATPRSRAISGREVVRLSIQYRGAVFGGIGRLLSRFCTLAYVLVMFHISMRRWLGANYFRLKLRPFSRD